MYVRRGKGLFSPVSMLASSQFIHRLFFSSIAAPNHRRTDYHRDGVELNVLSSFCLARQRIGLTAFQRCCTRQRFLLTTQLLQGCGMHCFTLPIKSSVSASLYSPSHPGILSLSYENCTTEYRMKMQVGSNLVCPPHKLCQSLRLYE